MGKASNRKKNRRAGIGTQKVRIPCGADPEAVTTLLRQGYAIMVEAGSALMLAELEEGCSVTAGSLDVEAFYRKVEDTKAQACLLSQMPVSTW